MFKIANFHATILLGWILLALSGVAKAEHLYETRIDPLRLDSSRLYLLLDADFTATTDFTLELTINDGTLYSGRVDGVLERVVVSQELPESVVASLRSSKEYTARIFLETELVCDSLIIAVPGNLRQLWLDTLLTSNPELPIRYMFRYYDDIRELEIAARLEQVDLLLQPEMGIPGFSTLSDSPYILEWNLVSEGIKDDLLATALNYCLRGIFAEANDNSYSWLISPSHIETIFPKNPSHAEELFAQSKNGKDKIVCSFPGFKMYPQLSDRISMTVSKCGAEKFIFRDDRSQASTLQFFAFSSAEDSSSILARAWREVLLPQRGLLEFGDGAKLDSCLMALSAGIDCREQVSRRLAESARFVPLGRTMLAVRKFDHVRYLGIESTEVKLSDFYTIKR